MNKTSIIILTYNNLDYNMACIDSVRKFTEKGCYEIIIVDNNSTDGTVEWLKSQTDLKLVLNDYNAGFPKGCNQGIVVAEDGSDILLLNNDTLVTQNWLENLKDCLYSDSLIGAVGPVTNSCANYQCIETHYADFDEMFDFAQKFNTTGNKEYEQKIKLVGYCMLIRREIVDKIGLLDERFSPGNFEDDDYSYRIQEAGYKLLLCRNTFIFHFGSTSFNADSPAYSDRLQVNLKKFEEKWDFNPNYSTYNRAEIIELIDDSSDKAINVLDVGCACGATLLRIRHEYKNAQIFGIELNKNSAKIAAHFADVRDENIENATLSYNEGFFDYIIFADVLEHLYNPEKVLRNMRKYLKDEGHILASIPNIMHYSVMAGLFNGNFTYADAGILDRTHVKFFTRGEINKMLLACEYSDIFYKSNTVMQNENDKAFVDKLVAISGEDKRNQFCTYQYIVKAKKTPIIKDDSEIYGIDIAFLLRRIENNFDQDENLQELSQILSEREIEKGSMEKIISNVAINPACILNIVAVAYYNIGNKQLAVEYFLDAFEQDKTDMDVVNNIVSLLLECNQKDYALTILNRCDCNNAEVQKLKSKICEKQE